MHLKGHEEAISTLENVSLIFRLASVGCFTCNYPQGPFSLAYPLHVKLGSLPLPIHFLIKEALSSLEERDNLREKGVQHGNGFMIFSTSVLGPGRLLLWPGLQVSKLKPRVSIPSTARVQAK
jgi:hypothetical protein